VGTDLVYELSLRGDGRAESPPLLPAPSQVKAKPREIHRRHQKESISLVDAIGVSFVHILWIDLVGFRLIPTPHRSVLVAVPRAAHDELLPSTAEARHLKPRGNGIGAAFLVCQLRRCPEASGTAGRHPVPRERGNCTPDFPGGNPPGLATG